MAGVECGRALYCTWYCVANAGGGYCGGGGIAARLTFCGLGTMHGDMRQRSAFVK